MSVPCRRDSRYSILPTSLPGRLDFLMGAWLVRRYSESGARRGRRGDAALCDLERGKRMLRSALLVGACLILFICIDVAVAGQPIPMGMTDNFEDGTLQGWSGGAILTNEAGGPTGRYLKVQSNMAGDAHWGTKNEAQWGGQWWAGQPTKDYNANKITGISMDIANFGSEDLSVRLMMTSRYAGRWTSTSARSPLPAGSGWRHVVFGLTANDLTHVEGTGSLATALADVARWNLHHDPCAPDPAHGTSPEINAITGIDNIKAVPEPATMLLLAAGAVVAIRRRRHA